MRLRGDKLLYGDVLFAIGFVKARKGERIFDALRRQGREVREARRRAFEKAIRG